MAQAEEKLLQPMGFTEMYEWYRIPKDRFGRFVQFSKRNPDKVEPLHDKDAVLCGVSSICSVIESDNPSHWKYAYLCNEVGDNLMKEEVLAVGIKVYDQHKEMSYITTRPWSHYIKVQSEAYDPERKYTKRTSRNEWTRVTLLGKAIVIASADVKPGEYCMPYTGDDMTLAGSAVPWDGESRARFYVLDRMSDKTVVIVMDAINMRVVDKQ